MTASHRFTKSFSSMFSDTYLSEHPGGGTPGTYTEGDETLTAIAPAPATPPRPWTASARARRTDPLHPAGPARPPRGRSSGHSPDGGAAREPSDIGPYDSESTAARRQDQPRRGDPTMSPGREPRDTDPHEIPSSAVSAAPSAPRPRRQQPGGRPCTRTPMAPIESSQKQPKAAKRGHDRRARPRTIHDSGFHGFLNHVSRITVVSDRQFGGSLGQFGDKARTPASARLRGSGALP